jgi:hypothetical protein
MTANFGFSKIFTLKVVNPAPKIDIDVDDKHQKVMDAILPYAKSRPQSNLTNVSFDYVSRNTSILFLLLPQWARMFAPYNLARLVALTKSAGYKTDAIDINSKAGVDSNTWKGINYDPWSSAREWKWIGNTYHTELHQHLEPLLQKYLDYIANTKPKVIAFTIYYCNEEPTNWMAREIKKRFTDIIIIVGGPQAHQSYWTPIPEFDIVVSGEGEKILLEILDRIEQGYRPDKQEWIRQEEGERLNLDLLPKPDYTHFNFGEYIMPNGVNAELSRGCTAKCVFCSETHFWKYRGRQATSIIEEVADLYFNHGVDVVWFLDSLVNGNLNELRAFAKGVVARGIKLHWTGYARCDERMDLTYYQDLANSGCLSLSYGIESGSDKVLKDMHKGVTVKEIEQNFRDGATVGIEAYTNWIIGFPSEEYQDFYETLTLLWRNRNNNLTDIAGGHGFSIPPDTMVGQDAGYYKIISCYYLNNWIKEDFTNSKIHRLIRVKSFNIFLHNLIENIGIKAAGSRPTISQFYKLKLNNPGSYKEIEFEKFDFDIIKTGHGVFADSLVNEIWPLLRILWKTHGGYSITISFDPTTDLNEFSDRLCANFKATYQFEITDDGYWDANFNFEFIQDKDAWKYCNFSRAESVAAKRARQLASSNNKSDLTWDMRKYDKDMALLESLKNTDFSFNYKYCKRGVWDEF